MTEYDRKPPPEYDPDSHDETQGHAAPRHHEQSPHQEQWTGQPMPGEAPYAAQQAPPPPPLYHGSGLPPGRGGTILTLGIVGISLNALACCCAPLSFVGVVLSIIAVVLGQSDKRAIREGRIDPAAAGQTNTGWILGIIGIVLGGLILLLNIASIIFQFSTLPSGWNQPGGTPF